MKNLRLVVALSLSISAACGTDPTEPTPLPQLQGVVTAVDTNPDTRVVEVALRAGQFTDALGGDTPLEWVKKHFDLV